MLTSSTATIHLVHLPSICQLHTNNETLSSFNSTLLAAHKLNPAHWCMLIGLRWLLEQLVL